MITNSCQKHVNNVFDNNYIVRNNKENRISNFKITKDTASFDDNEPISKKHVIDIVDNDFTVRNKRDKHISNFKITTDKTSFDDKDLMF